MSGRKAPVPPGQERLPGVRPTRLPQGPRERAAGVDLRNLRRTDELLPNATALEGLYRDLGWALDTARRAGADGRVGYLAPQLIACRAFLTSGVMERSPDVDPFAIAPPVRDPSFP